MTTKTVVTIACRVPNGVELRHTELGFDDGTGTGAKMPGPVRTIFLLGPGSLASGTNDPTGRFGEAPVFLNEGIDAALADDWFKANALNPLVTSGHVAIVAREER